MKHPILILAFLLSACTTPDPEPDRCLDDATMLQDGAAHACSGPRGCYQIPGGLACDDTIVVDGSPCQVPWQVWCSPSGLLRCTPVPGGAEWRDLLACPRGCWTSPLRCSPAP